MVSVHNLTYMLDLMRRMREAISRDTFPQFIRAFFERRCYVGDGGHRLEYEDVRPPQWAVDALRSVNVDIGDIGEDESVERSSSPEVHQNGSATDDVQSKRVKT